MFLESKHNTAPKRNYNLNSNHGSGIRLFEKDRGLNLGYWSKMKRFV